MKVFTSTCDDCGTIVSGNVLERHRRMKCPCLGCENVLRFSELSTEAQDHIVENIKRYRMTD